MIRIFWNPGHGGKDIGSSGNGLREKDLVLTLAKKADTYLNENYEGATTKVFRSGDQYYSLDQIANEANNWKATIFVSLHINAGGKTGFESYIYNGKTSDKTVTNQTIIHEEIMKNLEGVHDRGKKKANLAVLRQTNMPALLTENLFIDTKADADRLKQPSFINTLAKGHADGVAKALKLKKKVKHSTNKSNHKADPSHKKSWEKAIKKEIFDGNNPQRPLTREQAATVLDRLGLLD